MTDNELQVLNDVVSRMRAEFETGRVTRAVGDIQGRYLQSITDQATQVIVGEITMLTAETYSFVPKSSRYPDYRVRAAMLISALRNADLSRIVNELPPLLEQYDLPAANYIVELSRVMLRFKWEGAGV